MKRERKRYYAKIIGGNGIVRAFVTAESRNNWINRSPKTREKITQAQWQAIKRRVHLTNRYDIY